MINVGTAAIQRIKASNNKRKSDYFTLTKQNYNKLFFFWHPSWGRHWLSVQCVLVYSNCVYFSRATVFDHTELAEFLISLVNIKPYKYSWTCCRIRCCVLNLGFYWILTRKLHNIRFWHFLRSFKQVLYHCLLLFLSFIGFN